MEIMKEYKKFLGFIYEDVFPKDLCRKPIHLADDEYCCVGLCNDRHELPVSQYIFDNSDAAKHMFDYEWQTKKCKKFIRENLKFDKYLCNAPMQKLRCYTTGLNCYNAAIVRACAELKVNLEFMHYNMATERYATQVVLDGFEMSGNSNTSSFSSLFTKSNHQVFQATGDDLNIEVPEYFYLINVNVNRQLEEDTIIINRDIAWNVFRSISENLFRIRTVPTMASIDYVCTRILDVNNGNPGRFIKYRRTIARANNVSLPKVDKKDM